MKNKKIIKINPSDLKGRDLDSRIFELMGIKPLTETKLSTSTVEFTKVGADGNSYAIVKENHNFFIKKANKIENLISEDFKYIGGLANKDEKFNTFSDAKKRLSLKLKSIAEANSFNGDLNTHMTDNLVGEADLPNEIELDVNKPAKHKGGPTNPKDLPPPPKEVNQVYEEENKDNPWAICTASVGREDKKKFEACVRDVKKEKGITEETDYDDDIELSEDEKAIDKMIAELKKKA